MKRFKSTKGMTLVEIIVSLAILALVSVGIMGFFTDSFKYQSRSQSLVVAQKNAEDIIERLKIDNGRFDFNGQIISLGSTNWEQAEDNSIVIEDIEINGERYNVVITREDANVTSSSAAQESGEWRQT